MNRVNIGILSVLILLFLFLFMISIYFGSKIFEPDWPLKFKLENSSNSAASVSVYINGKIFNTFNFRKSALIVIGENIINPNTGDPLEQEDINSISFIVSSPVDITVKSNVKISMEYSSGTTIKNVEKITAPGTYNIYYK